MRVRRTLAGSVASAVLMLALVSPASAYLRDFYTFNLDSQFTSDSPKYLAGDCPRRVSNTGIRLGQGGFLPARNTLGINRLAPQIGDRGHTGASEIEHESARWHLHSQLMCVTTTSDPPASSPAHGAYLKGVYQRRSESARSSSSAKAHQTLCFGRDIAIGGGYRVVRPPSGKETRAVLRGVQVIQSAGQSGVRTAAHETKPTNLDWSLSAVAICANGTDALPGNIYPNKLTERSEGTEKTSTALKEVAPACPPDTIVIGGGAGVYGDGRFNAPPRRVMLTESFPIGNEWSARAIELSNTQAKWTLGARVICASLSGPTL